MSKELRSLINNLIKAIETLDDNSYLVCANSCDEYCYCDDRAVEPNDLMALTDAKYHLVKALGEYDEEKSFAGAGW